MLVPVLGAMAQLVARLVRNEKVGGSNPPSSTTHRHPIVDVGFLFARTRSASRIGYEHADRTSRRG